MDEYKTKYDQLYSEFDEFRQESAELEGALEKEVESLKLARDAVRRELEDLKAKLVSHQTEANKSINTLISELEALRTRDAEQKTQILELEITNSDLQTSLRAMESSSLDYESKYNKFLEQITMLEHEVDIQKEENQRLRDELRDLQEEVSTLSMSLSKGEELRDISKSDHHQQNQNHLANSWSAAPSEYTIGNSKEVLGMLVELTEKAKVLENRISQAREKIVVPQPERSQFPITDL